MSLRSPVGDAAAEALGRVRPDLLAAVPREMSEGQKEALAAWERLDGDARTPAAVAAALGISVSGARQRLHLAGAIRTKPGHPRRCALVLLKEGKTAEEVQKELRLHYLTLEMTIHDYAYELLELISGPEAVPTSQRLRRSSSRRR